MTGYVPLPALSASDDPDHNTSSYSSRPIPSCVHCLCRAPARICGASWTTAPGRRLSWPYNAANRAENC
jgi:hypothetical protein